MNILEILSQAINKGSIKKITWFINIFGIVTKETDFITIIDDKTKILKDTNIKVDKNQPFLSFTDKVLIPKDFTPLFKKDTETTVGNFIVNYLFSTYALNNRIPFINKRFTIKDYHRNNVLPLLQNGTITLKEYNKFANTTNLLANIPQLAVIHKTEKNIQPPKGLTEFKIKTIKKYEKLYGEDWKDNTIHIHEFIEELKVYYNDYLKDDPAFGKYIKGKIAESKRKKFLAIGVEKKMSDGDNSSTLVESLIDGLPMDKEKIAIYFNGLRSGSFSRSVETQDGGVIAKTILRASMSFTFKEKDCGTNKGTKILVTEKNKKSLSNLFIVDGNKPVKKELIIGKTYIFRTPQYCKSGGNGDSFCKTCGGDLLGNNPNGLSLLLTGFSGKILNTAMKAMHSNTTSLVTLDKEDLLGI